MGVQKRKRVCKRVRTNCNHSGFSCKFLQRRQSRRIAGPSKHTKKIRAKSAGTQLENKYRYKYTA